MTVEDRLTELEIRFTNQNQVIATLDEVVREFAARVERLEKKLAEASRAGETGDEAVDAPDEPPPHY